MLHIALHKLFQTTMKLWKEETIGNFVEYTFFKTATLSTICKGTRVNHFDFFCGGRTYDSFLDLKH